MTIVEGAICLDVDKSVHGQPFPGVTKHLSPDMIYDRVMEPVGNELRRLCNEVQLVVNQQRKKEPNK